MNFTSITDALAACEAAGLEPRRQVGNLGEVSYWVYFDGAYQSYWGDQQFLSWANAYWRMLEARHNAGWTQHRLWGWLAPDGTTEQEWLDLGLPFPEDAPPRSANPHPGMVDLRARSAYG